CLPFEALSSTRLRSGCRRSNLLGDAPLTFGMLTVEPCSYHFHWNIDLNLGGHLKSGQWRSPQNRPMETDSGQGYLYPAGWRSGNEILKLLLFSAALSVS
ncbi:MAG: hypothetical protein WBW33_18810, partial [Bryobacteraceae bacterium]